MAHEDKRRVDIRLGSLQFVVIVLFSVLAISFWVLQIVQHERFKEMAENNHQRSLTLRAPRGMLFDRDGRVLVENRDSYSISIVREQTKDLNRTIRLLASLLGTEESSVRDIVERHRREPIYRPIVVVQDASLAQVAAVAARRLELPDVVVEEVPTRRYPAGMAAHLFGYVGEVNDTQVANDPRLKNGDIVGKAGVEYTYNDLLMGEDGVKRVVVNSIGREIPDRPIEEEKPVEGKRLQLTIDADVQKAIEDSFRSIGYNGAAVILDPRNGEVLAFTSLPAYDPNAFASGVDHATWAGLTGDQLKPLQDRAIQGLYPPGSTFKMAVATAALEEGAITPDFKVYCPGHAVFFGRSFQCSLPNGRGHGLIDMREAIEHSCNVYFYTVGNMIGIDKIHKWATLLGLGEKTGIDLPNEVQGLVPSPEWKRERFKEKWYAGETISVSIGQGAVSLTPVSMAVYVSTLANGGTRVTPHLLKAVDEGSGWKPVPPPAPHSQVTLKPETVSAIHQAMWMVVNEAGTGGKARLPGYDVSGKTGTAQVISLEGGKAAKGKTAKDLRDNGWFVFFAPRDNPQIAGAIFVEHGGHGGTTAAPIARNALEIFFAKKEGRAIPTLDTNDLLDPEVGGDEPVGPPTAVGPPEAN
ncbi:MAG TPA: penicillin-binding protein 2 [Vicinamibacterales bacterium]|nr:penicillin-binding protein 2 [Vicinamibacterales bacterium]